MLSRAWLEKVRKILGLLAVTGAVSFPRMTRLGRDTVGADAFHFKDWSYVFMKEFEAGKYNRLYVTVQPAVLTIYSNIIGFKSLYFLKDKLNLIAAGEKDFELLMHAFQKFPKAVFISLLSVLIFWLVKKLYGKWVGLIFLLLFSSEPYFLGQSRMIMTDALPGYLVSLAALVFIYYSQHARNRLWWVLVIGFLSGLAIIERAGSFVFLAAFCLMFLLQRGGGFKRVLVLVLSAFLTMFALFPAFWGNLPFTLYRITVGSYIQGVEGLDAENLTYAPISGKASPVSSLVSYLRFFYNKVSGVVLVGLLLLVIDFIRKKRFSFRKFVPLVGNPLISLPLTFFCVHVLSVRHYGRYMTPLFPFLILGAAIGYSKIFEAKKRVYILSFLAITVLLRIAQLSALFPDLLLYRNPLSLDFNYKRRDIPIGSGRYKLGQFLEREFGPSRSILTTDYRTLYLFYPGEVLNLDKYKCGDPVDLVIVGGKLTKECLIDKVALEKTFEVAGGAKFFIYGPRSRSPSGSTE